MSARSTLVGIDRHLRTVGIRYRNVHVTIAIKVLRRDTGGLKTLTRVITQELERIEYKWDRISYWLRYTEIPVRRTVEGDKVREAILSKSSATMPEMIPAVQRCRYVR